MDEKCAICKDEKDRKIWILPGDCIKVGIPFSFLSKILCQKCYNDLARSAIPLSQVQRDKCFEIWKAEELDKAENYNLNILSNDFVTINNKNFPLFYDIGLDLTNKQIRYIRY